MELKTALTILAQLADVAQSKGILSLDDAVLVKQAKDVVNLSIKELEEKTTEQEPLNQEQDDNK